MKKILICINISLLMVIFTEILFMFLSKSQTAEDVLEEILNYLGKNAQKNNRLHP